MKRWLVVIATVVLIFGVLIGYGRWYAKNVVAGAFTNAPAVSTNLDAETSAALLDVLTQARATLEVPSLQIAVATRQGKWWTGSSGWADPPRRRAVTLADRYHIGSVSKLYTAAIVLALAEAGRLSLDDPISTFVAGVPNGSQITVRQLLNHTSGLPNYTENLTFQVQTVVLRKQWSLDEILSIIAAQAPIAAPGSAHYYSNSNYVLLGRIAEVAGEDSFAALLETTILAPLGLRNTQLAGAAAPSAGTVRGYDVSLLGTGTLGIKKDMAALRASFERSAFAAGAVTASALDVATFTEALFAGELLDEQSLRSMLTFVAAPDADVRGQLGYGLGVRQIEIGGQQLVGHTGIFPGFSNVSMYSPREGHAITVLSNLSSVAVDQVIAEMQSVLAQQR